MFRVNQHGFLSACMLISAAKKLPVAIGIVTDK